MRVDEGREGSSILAAKMKALTVVRREERSLLSDSGFELCLGRERGKKRYEDKRWDEHK